MPFNREQFIASVKAGQVEQFLEQLNQHDVDIRKELKKEDSQGNGLTIAEEAFIAATQNMTADKAKEYLRIQLILFGYGVRCEIWQSDRVKLSEEQLAIQVDGEPLVKFAAKNIAKNPHFCNAVEFLLHKGAAVQDLAGINLSINNQNFPLLRYLSTRDFFINLLVTLLVKGIEIPDPLSVFRSIAARSHWRGIQIMLDRNLLDINQHGSTMLYAVVSGGGWEIASRFLQRGVIYQAQTNQANEKNILKVALSAANNRPLHAADANEAQAPLGEVVETLFRGGVIETLFDAATKEERQAAIQHAKTLQQLPKSVKEIVDQYFDIALFESAVLRGDLSAIGMQLIRRFDVDVNVSLSSCVNAKAWMINKNSVLGLKILIAAGATLNLESDLLAAASDDTLDVFKYIYENNSVTIDLQQRLLLEAIKAGQVKIAQYLLFEEGIKPLPALKELAQDIIEAAKQFATHGQPVHLAKINQHYAPNDAGKFNPSNHQVEIAKFLLPIAADVFNPNVFLAAAFHGNLTAMQAEFQKKNKDINCKFLPNGWSALHLVIQSNEIDAVKKLEIIQFLLANGVDPNAKDANAVTPLRAAIFGNYAGIVGALLENGANPNIEDSDHLTLDSFSWNLKDAAIVEQLKQAIAAMPLVSYELPMFNRKELEYKCLHLDPQKVREELQKPGVDLYWVSQMYPYTPILLLVVQGWLNVNIFDKEKLREIISILLEHGANPTQRDGHGISAISQLELSGGTRSQAEKDELKKQLEASQAAVTEKRKAWEQEKQKIVQEREAVKKIFESCLQREITEATERQKLLAIQKAVANAPALNKQTITKSLASEKTTFNTIWKILGLIALGLLGAALIGVGIVSFGIIPGVTLAAFGLSLVTSQMAIASLVLGAIALSATLMLSAWMAFCSDELPGVEAQSLLKAEYLTKQQAAASGSVSEVFKTTPNPANAFAGKGSNAKAASDEEKALGQRPTLNQ